jgi:hypothetical protein
MVMIRRDNRFLLFPGAKEGATIKNMRKEIRIGRNKTVPLSLSCERGTGDEGN